MSRTRAALLVAVPAGAAGLAVTAELLSYGHGDHVGLVVADGVVGFVLLAAGLIAWDRRKQSLVGPLMGLAGLTWFAGNLWPTLLFLHRGPLVHLQLTYPTGRLRWWLTRITVASAYITATITGLARNDVLTLAIAGLVAITTSAAFLRTAGTARRAAIPALGAALAFAAVLAVAAISRLADWQADRAVLWTYDIVVVGVAVTLLADLIYGHWADFVVTDLVVDLGSPADTGTLHDQIGRALGDRTLVVGYWLPDQARYVDDTGHPLDLEQPGPGRVITPVADVDGEPLAVFVHDAAVLADPDLITAVAAAARLAVSNARLHADTRERVAQLAASRRRIIDATDTQRRQLARDLHDSVQVRLAAAAARLQDTRSRVRGSSAASTLADLRDELCASRAELDELAQGIHPRALTDGGLAAALKILPARTAAAVDLNVTTGRLPTPVEAAIYFVCSEALTNIAKHAAATRVTIDVTQADDCVIARITDNGVGGADPERGSGLRGLTDRVEALGGKLDVDSSAGTGTTLGAQIPIEPDR